MLHTLKARIQKQDPWIVLQDLSKVYGSVDISILKLAFQTNQNSTSYYYVFN